MSAKEERPIVRLLEGHDRRLRGGYPWAFSNEIARDEATKQIPPGTLCRLEDHRGGSLGLAGFNPQALIAARVLSADPETVIDARFWDDRLQQALALRSRFYSAPYYRLIHSEADGFPGLVVDRFGDHLVVQANSALMDKLSEPFFDALERRLAPKSILLKNSSPAREQEGLPLLNGVARGTSSGAIQVQENGASFWIDPLAGQKTGWFFDQRENRRAVANLARGGRMLDAYAYTGGFSIQALLQGASSAVALDSSTFALTFAQRAAEENAVADRFVAKAVEVFPELERLFGQNERFELVVADPPAFVKSRKDLAVGLKAYKKLARLAARLCAPQGILFLASCSHQVDPPAFLEQVRRGLFDAGRAGRILLESGAAPDHPLHPALPESRYLKGLLIALD